jgi:putative DNA primase/helicase
MAERYLQLAVGYSLTGHTREEVLFYLYGPPRSGKGTFTEALLTLLGHEPLATEVDFGTFTRPRQHDSNSADLAKLKPCRLVVASEPNADDWLNAAQVKRLTGGNSVYAALKYHDHFVYRPAYKIWLTGNYPPRADVDDDGVWSRLRVVRFPNSYLGREDRGLKQRMKAPAMQRQILAWAVEGARAWYALGARGLATPPGVEAAGRAARQGLDSVRGWLAAHVVVTGAVDDFVANGALYGSYVVWCDAEGVRPQSQMALTRALQAKGLRAGHQKWCNGKNRRGCLGIRLAGEGPNT